MEIVIWSLLFNFFIISFLYLAKETPLFSLHTLWNLDYLLNFIIERSASLEMDI